MQDRKTYAKGSTLESTTGYIVKVGMPVVDDTVKATSNGATFTQNAPLTDGQYLVTLEVNGEAVAYKESITANSGITVGDYSVAEVLGKIVLTGASANAIVRLLIEPLEVSVSDGFRAAINKAVPKSEGGGSGGGAEPLILHITDTLISGGTKHELDKTAGEIYTALMAGKQIFLGISSGSEEGLHPVLVLNVKNEYVTKLSINKSFLNADFNASAATMKPYYTTSSSGSND